MTTEPCPCAPVLSHPFFWQGPLPKSVCVMNSSNQCLPQYHLQPKQLHVDNLFASNFLVCPTTGGKKLAFLHQVFDRHMYHACYADGRLYASPVLRIMVLVWDGQHDLCPSSAGRFSRKSSPASCKVQKHCVALFGVWCLVVVPLLVWAAAAVGCVRKL